MRILTILILAALSFACDNSDSSNNKSNAETNKTASQQPEANSTNADTSSEDVSSSNTNDDHSGHNHSVAEHSGEKYKEVDVQDSCSQPTVIEFFAYQCPHCYTLEEHVAKWKKQKDDNIKFITVPTDLGREEFTKFVVTHHVAERLNVLDEIKPQLFAVLHEQKSINNILEIFTEAGVAEADAKAAFEDMETIKQDLVNGFETMRDYKITGVPALLVNYQYMINVTTAGGYDKVFDVVNETLDLPAKCKTFSDN